MSTHKRITNPNMRFPKRKSPKKNNMSQLFFSKAGFDKKIILPTTMYVFIYDISKGIHVKTISSN